MSGYAEGQIRVCLADLASSSHGTRVKAVKRFQDYITQNKPDLNDDDVLYLFVGTGDGDSPRPGATSKRGLLYYAGMDSSQHGGELKRIAGPAIGLVRWLITLSPFGPDPDNLYNMFFEIFVSLTLEELSRINFIKHILGEEKSGGMFGNSRGGSANDALEILAILMREHRNPDGDQPEPIDITLLLGDNKTCRDRLNQYMQKSNSEVVTKAMQQFKAAQTKAIATKWDDARPKKWDDENFKPVPVQEGEEGELEDADDSLLIVPVPDPLGLSELDLRATQRLNASGRLTFPSAGMNRQSSHPRRNSFTSVDDEDDGEGSKEMAAASVLPQDKSFSPSLFLTLIHGGISFQQLQVGANNLRNQLQQQNSQRENLVRMHFGLFVHCAEGLEWLKAYRRGIYSETNTATQNSSSTAPMISRGDNGEHMLARAKIALESAKDEATDTLKPILDRMRSMRKLKTADQVLRRLTPTLENPHKMRQALARGDFQEVLAIYQKVQSLPMASALKVVQSVKSSADAIIEELKQRCRSAMDAAQAKPDVEMLLRYGNIISQLEGNESYREQIKQCFTSQLSHFNAKIETIMAQFAADAFAGFCHARDLRSEAEAEIKTRAAQGRSSLTAGLRASSLPSSLTPAHDWIPEMSPDEDAIKLRILTVRHRLGLRQGVDLDDLGDYGDGIDVDKLQPFEDDEHDRPAGVVIDEQSKQNHMLLACRARELLLVRLISTITQWLPCLHRLVLEAIGKLAVGGKSLWNAGDLDRAQRAKVALALNRKKGPPPMLMLGSSLVACGEAIRYAVLGMVDPRNEAVTLSSLDSFGFGAASGGSAARDSAFEPRILNEEKMMEVRNARVFDHPSFTQQLQEPHLSRCVHDTGDLYDLMTDCLQENDSVGEKGGDAKRNSELFLHAVAIMRELARGGEVTAAHRLMERLLERSLVLFENKDKQFAKDRLGGKLEKSPFGGGFGGAATNLLGSNGSALDRENRTRGNIEIAVMELKRLTTHQLQRLVKQTRRPEWISQTVRDGLRKLFSAFVDEMQRESLLIDDSSVARMLIRSASRNRTRTITASSLQSPELLRMEAELKRGEVSEEARSEYLLDLLRACAVMRTDVIPRVWKDTRVNFPLCVDAVAAQGTTRGSLDGFFGSIDEPTSHLPRNGSGNSLSGDLLRKVPSGGSLAALGGASNNLYNRLMKSVGADNIDANVNIEEVTRLESVIVSNYALCKVENLRVVALAGYTVLTRREAAGAWRSTESRPDGFSVPPHLSRLLLMIGSEKSYLCKTLASMTIEAGEMQTTSKAKDSATRASKVAGEGYHEHIFREICQGFLETYSDLVAALNANSLGADDAGCVREKSDLPSLSPGPISSLCQHPLCYGQASEELAYLVGIIRPFMRSSSLPPPVAHRSIPVGAGEDFLSVEDLMKEAAIFHMSVQRV